MIFHIIFPLEGIQSFPCAGTIFNLSEKAMNQTKRYMRLKDGVCISHGLVQVTGLEPARISPLEPKSNVFANFTIPAYTKERICTSHDIFSFCMQELLAPWNRHCLNVGIVIHLQCPDCKRKSSSDLIFVHD